LYNSVINNFKSGKIGLQKSAEFTKMVSEFASFARRIFSYFRRTIL